MFLLKIKYYLAIITIFVISFLFIFNNCKIYNGINSYELTEDEKIFLNKSLLKNIKIDGKIVLFDLTDDIKKYKKGNDTTDDILNSGNYIYDKEDLNYLNHNFDLFYDYIKNNLEKRFKEENLNNEILLNLNTNYEESDQTIIFIEIGEYYEGEYNLIKNETTKFKISVKLYRKDLINNSILLFIKNYKCKPSILFPTEELRIIEISNLCSRDIINFLKKSIK